MARGTSLVVHAQAVGLALSAIDRREFPLGGSGHARVGEAPRRAPLHKHERFTAPVHKEQHNTSRSPSQRLRVAGPAQFNKPGFEEAENT